MAIRIRHDTVDQELGYSPDQLGFGRDRSGFGIPWPVVRESREAAEWMADRENLVKEVSKVWRKRISDSLRRASHGRPEPSFEEGDRVWLKKPKSITGPGLAQNWLGPCVVKREVGEHSFEILTWRGRQAAHASQLKMCVEIGEGEEGWELVGNVVRKASGGKGLTRVIDEGV